MQTSRSRVPRAVGVVLVAVLMLSSCAWLVAGSVTLDNWQGPVDNSNLANSQGVPTATEYNGAIFLVYNALNTLYWTSSSDGSHFSPGGQALTSYRTLFDPELVVVYDSGTNTNSLVLIFTNPSNTLSWAVFNTSSNSWPTNPFTSSVVTNVGGDLDAVYQPLSGGNGQLVFIYVASGSGGYSNGYVATATLSNGLLTVNPANLIVTTDGGGSQWQPGSESAIFTLPDTGSGVTVGFVQMGSGAGAVFVSTAPQTSGTWKHLPNLSGSSYPNNPIVLSTGTSGFSAAQFPLAGACNDLIAVFYLPSSNVGGYLGYSIIAPTGDYSTYLISGPAHTISQVTNPADQPVAAYFSVTASLYLYYVDVSVNPHDVKVIYTQPGL